jgi:hypothetical protein
MDIQAILDAISTSGRMSRQNYHLTLGGLIAVLEAIPAETEVRLDHGGGLGREHSYRGYYEDLSFEIGEVGNAASALNRCKEALGGVYEGYKGGDFTMGTDTPLWNASYGCCGFAIIDAKMIDGALVLGTKDLDA